MGKIQNVEGGFPAGSVLGASRSEVTEDLDAITKEVGFALKIGGFCLIEVADSVVF